ncbi:hypothetical protein G4Y73_06050 [Wenzhouxiangella sp. XN201]|uniref:hypothetical protein n=1 Tax=Wenzhouxiangella sp. XN201 TaxID=2710755 RepID=UPI0013C87E98|nr:hypothetical protein [Wenzhouxiangella sp. XN201]NEZ03714.1 hypothetical protein [Wenzhouxiangella sp. XN201]
MSKPVSSRQLRDQIVGKRISAVIARPGREGEPPVVMMLRFDDGSVVEFVSPRSDRLLRRAVEQANHPVQPQSQLQLAGLAA